RLPPQRLDVAPLPGRARQAGGPPLAGGAGPDPARQRGRAVRAREDGAMTHDLVIRGGTVVDGSGLARYRADVAGAGGRIARVGRVRERGVEEIDARDAVVAPGFIDGHTHMDAQVAWDPLGTCSCWHGVTTVVMGNCGFTLAPCRPEEKHLVVRNLE